MFRTPTRRSDSSDLKIKQLQSFSAILIFPRSITIISQYVLKNLHERSKIYRYEIMYFISWKTVLFVKNGRKITLWHIGVTLYKLYYVLAFRLSKDGVCHCQDVNALVNKTTPPYYSISAFSQFVGVTTSQSNISWKLSHFSPHSLTRLTYCS